MYVCRTQPSPGGLKCRKRRLVVVPGISGHLQVFTQLYLRHLHDHDAGFLVEMVLLRVVVRVVADDRVGRYHIVGVDDDPAQLAVPIQLKV